MIKLKIGICDDEQLIIDYLERMISQCLYDIGQDFETYAFLTGRDLLEKAMDLNAVFLDIRLPQEDGYEIGRRLHEANPGCRIIMATGDTDRFERAFRINAFRYLRKPFCTEEIKEAMESLTDQLADMDSIELYLNRNKYKVLQKRIKYVEAFNGYTEYYVENEVMRREISLNAVEPLLDSRRFFKIHKKYLINMQFITKRRNGRLFVGEKEFVIARRRKSEFERAYLLFQSQIKQIPN